MFNIFPKTKTKDEHLEIRVKIIFFFPGETSKAEVLTWLGSFHRTSLGTPPPPNKNNPPHPQTSLQLSVYSVVPTTVRAGRKKNPQTSVPPPKTSNKQI